MRGQVARLSSNSEAQKDVLNKEKGTAGQTFSGGGLSSNLHVRVYTC
jgi:hypothetical protein